MSVLKWPEGKTMSALKIKPNDYAQVTFTFDDNWCYKKVNNILLNNGMYPRQIHSTYCTL